MWSHSLLSESLFPTVFYSLVVFCNFSFCFSRYFSYLLICLGVVSTSILSFMTTVAPVDVVALSGVASTGTITSLVQGYTHR